MKQASTGRQTGNICVCERVSQSYLHTIVSQNIMQHHSTSQMDGYYPTNTWLNSKIWTLVIGRKLAFPSYRFALLITVYISLKLNIARLRPEPTITCSLGKGFTSKATMLIFGGIDSACDRALPFFRHTLLSFPTRSLGHHSLF